MDLKIWVKESKDKQNRSLGSEKRSQVKSIVRRNSKLWKELPYKKKENMKWP